VILVLQYPASAFQNPMPFFDAVCVKIVVAFFCSITTLPSEGRGVAG